MKAIIEFLEARIDEDEERAGSGWSRIGTTRWETNNYGQDHLTPSAVLAECKAKRAIIALTEDVEGMDTMISNEWGGSNDGTADEILAALAAVYSDHPDYLPEWKAQ